MKKNSKSLVIASVIAAFYASFSIILAPISFGIIQFRIAEAFTILPLIMPESIFGVTLGCLIANTWGVTSGANILGAVDIVIGTLCTYIAAKLTAKANNKLIAPIPPVVINAVFIGMEITYAEVGKIWSKLLLLNILKIGIEEAVVCFLLGIPLISIFNKIMETENG